MCELASFLLVLSLWLVVIPCLWEEICNFRSWISCIIKKRKRRKYLLREYRKWYDRAKSCDNFGGAIDKGKAIASLIVINHELEIVNEH